MRTPQWWIMAGDYSRSSNPIEKKVVSLYFWLVAATNTQNSGCICTKSGAAAKTPHFIFIFSESPISWGCFYNRRHLPRPIKKKEKTYRLPLQQRKWRPVHLSGSQRGSWWRLPAIHCEANCTTWRLTVGPGVLMKWDPHPHHHPHQSHPTGGHKDNIQRSKSHI